MIPIEDHAPSLGSFFRRTVASWEQFFFRPGDPSTLCLMRVLAGLLIVYTHLAYTRDLYEFFGKDSWINLELAQNLRHGYPYVALAQDWENNALQSNISLPAEESVKEVFIQWLRTLPTEALRRREALAYLHEDLPTNIDGSVNGLAFAQNLVIVARDEKAKGVDHDGYISAPAEARRMQLDMLVQPKIEGKGSELIPKHLAGRTIEEKQAVRRNLEAFLTTVPSEPGKASRLFSALVIQS